MVLFMFATLQDGFQSWGFFPEAGNHQGSDLEPILCPFILLPWVPWLMTRVPGMVIMLMRLIFWSTDLDAWSTDLDVWSTDLDAWSIDLDAWLTDLDAWSTGQLDAWSTVMEWLTNISSRWSSATFSQMQVKPRMSCFEADHILPIIYGVSLFFILRAAKLLQLPLSQPWGFWRRNGGNYSFFTCMLLSAALNRSDQEINSMWRLRLFFTEVVYNNHASLIVWTAFSSLGFWELGRCL